MASRCWRLASRYCRIAGVAVAVDCDIGRFETMFIIVHPMRVLALDTTTAAGSVALAEDARLLEVAAIDPSQPVATRLPGDLVALLERHGIDLSAIELFAVATGPG